MNAFIRYGLIIFALMTFADQAVGQIRVFAQVDTSEDIYVGESFNYLVIIDGENKAGEVDLAPLAKYNPQSAGNRDVSQTSITIINGKTTRKVTKRYVMSYLLTAGRAGRTEIGPISVAIDGSTYQTNPVAVNILEPGTTDKLDLEVTLSEQRCYIGQPVIMTVKFYVSADIGDFQFNIPIFNNDELFYFENPDVVGPGAKQYRLSTAIKEPVLVTQSSVVHKGRNSTLVSFSKVLLPKRAGRIEFEPVSVSADVVVARSRGFFGFSPNYKRFMVSSEPPVLTVLPLPDEGKPSQFYGLVGRYTISASATPTRVNVGDPITLTVKIGGSKYLKPVRWPLLEQVPEMVENFKIPAQQSSPSVEGGFKVFTQTIRANNDSVTAIPPIPLAYFDPDRGRYLVAKSEPIELQVAPTKILTPSDLEGTDFTPVNREVEAIRKGLSANYEGLDVLTHQSFSPLAAALSPAYATLWAAPLAALVFSSLIRLSTHATPEKLALKRRRSALGRAVRRLKEVASAEPHQRHQLLASTMRQYAGERFDRIAGSLTADDCRELVLAATGDDQTAESYRQTIANCDAARYASVEANIDTGQIREAIELVRKIEKKSRK